MNDSLLGYYNEKEFGDEKEPSRRLQRTPSVQMRMTWLQWSDNSLHRLPDPRIDLFRRAIKSPAHAPPRKDNQLVPPVSPSADVVYSPKLQVAASPERFPTSEPLCIPVNTTTSSNPSKISLMTTARYL
ncbi:hypothetical protein AZE42_10659 [Rhizopogon vesiculosus]|uniref:Uncharacterized protein n=1 Tax=Rhizopogon vesiculosus TaxID=180088 RepID=A0A1J8PLW7_9AGAM|nr:hypothetical protein AZE42_10659 [Rhizopogon vesiculosus]